MLISLEDAIANTLIECQGTIYREDPSELHANITRDMWKWVKERVSPQKGDLIFDVGCGFGQAMDLFAEDGMSPLGCTFNKEEYASVSARHRVVAYMDMHEAVAEIQGDCNGIWLRHAAEHSPMPLVLLRMCYRALREDGWLYLEVPSPLTDCKHYSNPNHFSVLTRPMWAELLTRAGFTILDSVSITFSVAAGKDEYFAFLCTK